MINGPFRSERGAAPKTDGAFDTNRAMVGEDLITFVDQRLFPYHAAFRETAAGPRTIHYNIGEVFTKIRSKFRSGYILRDVLEVVNNLSFNTEAQRHKLSQLYESGIWRMGNAGRNWGEYYTLRPLIQAMTAITAPRIGETI